MPTKGAIRDIYNAAQYLRIAASYIDGEYGASVDAANVRHCAERALIAARQACLLLEQTALHARK